MIFFLTKINILEEEEKQLLLENITQNHYIRSTFATPEQLDKTNETIFKVAFDNATKWRTWQWITIFLEVILMLVLIGFIGYTLFISNTEIYLVLALFTSLFGFYEKFYELGLTTDDFFKSIHNQQEFWQFMRTFGKQTYPVLDEKVITK
jgi:uncharacterized membrane protein YukC